MKILSWNINGIRAAYKKGWYNWFLQQKPDIMCLQEIKATPEQLPLALSAIPNYYTFWNPAQRKGYSGVATLSKPKPTKVHHGFGIEKFDKEGRVLLTTYDNVYLFNIYFPNGKKNKERLEYKLDFYDTFLGVADNLIDEGKNIVVCGDFNTAHKEIDLARPKENEKNSGFLPVERAWIDAFIDHGFVDTFRVFNKEPHHYSWWDQKTRARERNVGWRIDYFFVNKALQPKMINAFILKDVTGSDHCPVGIELKIDEVRQ